MASKEEILEGLKEIITEEIGPTVGEITTEKSFTDDLDIDSISIMTIMVNASDRFDVEIPDEQASSLSTVGDAVDFIHGAQQG